MTRTSRALPMRSISANAESLAALDSAWASIDLPNQCTVTPLLRSAAATARRLEAYMVATKRCEALCAAHEVPGPPHSAPLPELAVVHLRKLILARRSQANRFLVIVLVVRGRNPTLFGRVKITAPGRGQRVEF